MSTDAAHMLEDEEEEESASEKRAFPVKRTHFRGDSLGVLVDPNDSDDDDAPPPPLPAKTPQIRREMQLAALRLTGDTDSTVSSSTSGSTIESTTENDDSSAEEGRVSSGGGVQGLFAFLDEADIDRLNQQQKQKPERVPSGGVQGLFAFLDEADIDRLNQQQEEGPAKKSPVELTASPRRAFAWKNKVRTRSRQASAADLGNAMRRNAISPSPSEPALHKPLNRGREHDSSAGLYNVRDALSSALSISSSSLSAPLSPHSQHTTTGSFGVPLESLVRGDMKIPLLVSLSMGYLSSVFTLPRLFANSTPEMAGRILNAQRNWNDHHTVDDDPYVTGELMKVFVASLPEPVCLGLANDFSDVLRVGHEAYRLSALHSLIACLPECNRDLLAELASFLFRFSTKSESNEMPLSEVARVWAPVLKLDVQVVTLMILHHDTLFSDSLPSGGAYVRIAGRLVIKSASLDELILKLLDEYYRVLDEAYFDIFLSTHPHFCDSTELLGRFMSQYKRLTRPPVREWQHVLRYKLLKAMHLWFLDFLDPTWISTDFIDNEWAQFLQLTSALPGIKAREADLLRFLRDFQFSDSGLVKKLRRASVRPQRQMRLSDTSFPRVLDVEPVMLARQMALVDHKLFSAIQPIECLGGSHLDAAKAINFSNMTAKFNEWSSWVASTIVRVADVARRAELISQWIAVAHASRKIKSFNACYAILAGLSMTPVERLKATWKRVSKKVIARKQKMDRLFSSERNYKRYKEAIAAVRPPAVPYIGLFSKYLFAIEAAHETFCKPGVINFTKMRLIYGQTRGMLIFQRVPFVFEPHLPIYSCIEGRILGLLSEEELYNRSVALQPRVRKER